MAKLRLTFTGHQWVDTIKHIFTPIIRSTWLFMGLIRLKQYPALSQKDSVG